MAARMLAFAILVLAFANPYFPATNEAASQSGWASIYLDNSPSMLSGSGQSSLLNMARTKAVEIIKALPENYHIQILTNDFNGKQQRFYSKGEAIALIDEVQVCFASRSDNEVIDRISSAQSNSNVEKLDLFWLSDFQVSSFGEDSQWPQGWTKTVLPFSHPKGLGNVSIDSIWFDQPVLQPGFDQELFVELNNSGSENAKKVPIGISLAGEPQGAKEVEVPGNGKAITSFILRPSAAKAYQGEVKIETNDPSFDNSFNFAYTVAQPFNILLIGSDKRLTRFKRLFRDSIFTLTFMPSDAIDYSRIQEFDLFIIDAPNSLPSGLIQAFEEQLKIGKNVACFPSEEEPTQLNNLLVNLGLTPLGNIQGASNVLDVSWDDPIFKGVFSSRPNNPALPSTEQNFSYSSTEGYPLLMLSNGSPLISRIPVGQGNLLLATSNLDKTNLDKQAIFVPLMLNAALYSRNLAELYTIGGKPKGPSYTGQTREEIPLSVTKDDNSIIPRQRQRNGKIEIYDIPSSLEPGVYQVSQNGNFAGFLALNTPAEESNWNFYSEDEIRDIFGLQSSDVLEAGTESIDYSLKQRYHGTSLWKFFLAGAILFLFVETILIKLWK